MTSFLLCPPTHFQIAYQINPWMDVNVQPTAHQGQWDELLSTFRKLHTNVELLEPHPHVPDLVFTANAGLIHKDQFILSRFKHPERSPEEPIFRAWAEASGFEVSQTHSFFEGEGDALFVGDVLYLGCGIRSDKSSAVELEKMLNVEVVPCSLINSNFYHLDTCFCPLTDDTVMLYPKAFDKESLSRLDKSFDVIEVSEKDARSFICNSVVFGKDIICPSGCEDTYQKLSDLDFSVHPVDLSEFLKSGGSAKCLTLIKERS